MEKYCRVGDTTDDNSTRSMHIIGDTHIVPQLVNLANTFTS